MVCPDLKILYTSKFYVYKNRSLMFSFISKRIKNKHINSTLYLKFRPEASEINILHTMINSTHLFKISLTIRHTTQKKLLYFHNKHQSNFASLNISTIPLNKLNFLKTSDFPSIDEVLLRSLSKVLDLKAFLNKKREGKSSIIVEKTQRTKQRYLFCVYVLKNGSNLCLYKLPFDLNSFCLYCMHAIC